MTDRPAGQPGSHQPGSRKSDDAYRTIGEAAAELDLPQHVLRFWETRFPQVKPLKRAGGRRFYRPEDVALLRAVRVLLYDEGYTIKGVQRLLAEHGARHVADALARSRAAKPTPASGSEPAGEPPAAPSDVVGVPPSEAGCFRDGGDETSASMAGRGRLAGPAAAVQPPGAGAAGEPQRSSPPTPKFGAPARDAGVLTDRLSLVLAELAECARLLAGVRST